MTDQLHEADQSVQRQGDCEFIAYHTLELRSLVESMYELPLVMHQLKMIDKEQFSELKTLKDVYKRNDAIFRLLRNSGSAELFLKALNETKQNHVVNFIKSRRDYKPSEHGDCWPSFLELQTKAGVLEKMYPENILVVEMFSKGCITQGQSDRIKDKPLSERNDLILEIMERRSLRDYMIFIKCLEVTNQSHVAALLEKVGEPSAARRFCRPKRLETLHTDGKPVNGIAYLNNRIYIACKDSKVLQVYLVHVDLNADQKISFIRSPEADITINSEKFMPLDIAASSVDSCIYVSDASKAIWRIDVNPDGEEVKTEKIVRQCGSEISVSPDGVVTRTSIDYLYQYNKIGEEVGFVRLYNASNSRHAIVTPSGRLIVSCMTRPNPEIRYKDLPAARGKDLKPSAAYRILILQNQVPCIAEMKVAASGGPPNKEARCVNSYDLCFASHLAVGPGEHIFVADTQEDRILQLNSKLKFERFLLTSIDNIDKPERLCYVEKSRLGLLLVGMETGGVEVFHVGGGNEAGLDSTELENERGAAWSTT